MYFFFKLAASSGISFIGKISFIVRGKGRKNFKKLTFCLEEPLKNYSLLFIVNGLVSTPNWAWASFSAMGSEMDPARVIQLWKHQLIKSVKM